MSTRGERILDEIARLAMAEQQELRELLSRILPATAGPSGLTTACVERVSATRERIRARLLAEGQPLFSASDLLEQAREGRDREIEEGFRSSRTAS